MRPDTREIIFGRFWSDISSMMLIGKLRRNGFKWTARRVVREFIKPTTKVGQCFKPISPFLYYVVSKPLNYILSKNKNVSSDTLYFFYDLEVEPITYDFVWALCVANAKRKELGLKVLHVVLVPGELDGLRREAPEYDMVIDQDSRRWRVNAILLSSIRLISCQYGITFCASRKDAEFIRTKQACFIYPSKYNVTFPVPYEPELAVVYGQSCMALSADSQSKKYVSSWLKDKSNNRKVIVITLRQYAYTPERNSNIDAWARFAKELDKDIFFVVFISDLELSLQDIPTQLKDFAFFNQACWNLNLRAALYELAYINLGVNTGPMVLCWFNAACRYITFKTAVKNVPEVPLNMLTDKGFVPGLNPAFTNQFQKWVWKDDSFNTIKEEFKLLCDIIG